MGDFCGSNFWDPSLTWNTTTPYFTPCFEATALAWFPLCFLVVFGGIDLLNIHKSKFKQKRFLSSFTPLTTLKTILIVLLIILQLLQFTKVALDTETQFSTVDFLSPILQVLGYVIVLALSLGTQYHKILSSGVQFFCWLSGVVTHGVLFRTALVNYDSQSQSSTEILIFLTRLIAFPIICLRFILEWFNEDTFQIKHSRLKLGKPSPDKTSTYISKLLFLWYDNLTWTGYRRTLTADDLWDLNTEDTSHAQNVKFSKFWKKEQDKSARQTSKSGGKPVAGILKPLIKCYGLTYAFAILLKLCADLLIFVHPTMLRFLIAHVSNPSLEPAWKGYLYTAAICVSSITQSMILGTTNKKATLSGMRARTAITKAVFKKALVISNASKKETSVGEIVNLMSVDANMFAQILPILLMSIGGPFQIIISGTLLYNTLGPSIFAGIAIIVLLIPMNGIIMAYSRKYKIEQMTLKDERLKLTTEVMSGIKVLKLYAWEHAYLAQIEEIRRKEISSLRKSSILNALTWFLFQCTPIFVSLASFMTYVLSDPNNILNAEIAFYALGLFNIMRLPIIMLPMTVGIIIQTSVSIKRLNKYLNMEELDRSAVTHDASYKDPIVIENATLSWADETTLKNVNLNVKKGELVAVIGRIGSGKSSLLSSLLGDLKKHSGIINTTGELAYVSQTAWIQNATLQNNILFGDTLNPTKYKKTINACSLGMDLKILSSGDQTEIGENGINLSGGQKQRVALARAAYKDASIYLFDDPLSAVDAHVGKHIFENLIGPNGMLKTTTRVLVTHGVTFLPLVDRIVVMKNGEISESGTYKELLMKQGEFSEFLLTHVGVEDEEDVDPDKRSLIQDLEEVVGAEMVKRRSSANRESIVRRLQSLPSRDDAKRKVEDTEPIVKKLIEDEVAAEGNIGYKVYLDYFRSAGILITISMLGFGAAAAGLNAFANVWLSEWSTQATIEEILTGTTSRETTDKYLTGYGLIGASAGIASLLGGLAQAVLCLAAAKTLHSLALARIMRSPMSYFDTTLMGRIINRFSKDVDSIDNIVPMYLQTFLLIFFNVIAVIVVISYTNAILIAFIIPVLIFYLFFQRFYVSTSRQLKRLEGVTRSPIYSHFGETVAGSSIIRAFRLEDEFIEESEKRVDSNLKTYFPFIYSGMWISIRLEMLGVLITLATCIFTLTSRSSSSAGDAGLAISYALQVTNLLNFLARQMSDLEANIVSAERLTELTLTPQEPAWEKADTKPPPSWPQHGELKFENYMTRYREGLDLVLKGISCTIKSGEKIGVVGRTGAGKSSLTLAMFRIVESAGGKIYIDGVDISTLGLHDLRKKITIIPQDPVLFSGTLRLNLDPFNQYSDDQVWRCLELAHLKTYATTLSQGLQHKVEEEGQNFSVGQRQLICLARALLRKTRILVLDEATAAVDLETDDLIQATIRKEFADCTVITIAHRLNTILDSNRVLVLDKGEIKEFDSPDNLLDDTSTIFWGMAHDAKLI